MALQTKAISANGAKNRHKFTLTVTEESTSVAANTSAISWSLVISPVIKNWDWVSTAGKVKYKVTVNGAEYSGIIERYDGVSTVTIKSSTETVQHNADGSAAISFSFSITDSKAWSYGPGNASASGTMAMTNIPRQAEITFAPNFNDEEDPVVIYTNPAGAAVDRLELCITLDGTTENALPYRAVPTTGQPYTYTLDEDDRNFLRNAAKENTLEVGFYLRTVIGGVDYFSKEWRTMTIVNADPVIEPLITEANAEILGVSDALIRHVSIAHFDAEAYALKGATLVSQSVSCGDVVVEGATGTIPGVQSGTFIFTATDSRGNTTTLPVQVPFVDYVKLSCSIGDDKPDTDGRFTLKASGACYVGDISAAGNNDIYVLYRYKAGSGAFSDWNDMAVTVGESGYTATMNFTGLDYRTTYTFQCKAGDLVMTATTDEVAIKSMPVFDWSGEDFNFNVPVKAPSLDVEEIQLDGAPLDYIVEQGVKSSWLYRKWNSGIMECWRRVQVTTNVSTAWGSLYSSGAISATNLTYPYAFTETPYLTANLMPFGSGGLLMAPGSQYGSATQTGAFEITRGSAITNAQYLIAYHAIGKWK